jgi:Ner family transcriptional regulator
MVTPQDWHREDIKAAIRKTGATLRSLSISAGYHPSAGNKTLNCHWPQMQAVIARHLGVRPQDIWPSRYLPSGAPKPGAWAKVSRRRRVAAAQTRRAA